VTLAIACGVQSPKEEEEFITSGNWRGKEEEEDEEDEEEFT
jgi:hypothetical protein